MEKRDIEFQSQRLAFRYLTAADVGHKYVEWLEDVEINCWLETRFERQSIKTCRQFVDSCNEDPRTHLMGIFLLPHMNHIGNIKVGFINTNQGTGEVSLFIGEKQHWGFGYGSEAIEALADWALNILHLERLEARIHEKNTPSFCAFKRAGWVTEGYIRSNANPPPSIGGERLNSYVLGLIRDDLIKNRNKHC